MQANQIYHSLAAVEAGSSVFLEERWFQWEFEAMLTVTFVYGVLSLGVGFDAGRQNILQNGRWMDNCRRQI